MKPEKIRRPVVSLDPDPQLSLFPSGPSQPVGKQEEQVDGPPTFKDPDPAFLTVNNTPLAEFLTSIGASEVFIIRKVLRSCDFTAFEKRYARRGRHAFHPAAMIGLVLYGLFKGVNSLRPLEAFARTNLACWWMTGGLMPDHSKIAYFLNLHSEELSDDFFVDLTAKILDQVKKDSRSVAVDGTMVNSAGSRYQLLKLEAVKLEAKKAKEAASKKTGDKKSQRASEKAKKVVKELSARVRKRRKKGKKASLLRVCRTDPEAVYQKGKRGQVTPSYKPSAVATEDRIIIAQSLHPSSETAVFNGLIDASKKVNARRDRKPKLERVLCDAGYCCESVIECALEEDLDLLCPEGGLKNKINKGEKEKLSFNKRNFIYDDDSDSYLCPAGKRLRRLSHYKGSKKAQAYTLYGGAPCDLCPSKKLCTKSQGGRKVKRYRIDEAKEALREVMEQPLAKAAYKKRQGQIEPVFSGIKHQQGLTRFRRWGSKGAALDWVLHTLAHNVGRLVELSRKAVSEEARCTWSAFKRVSPIKSWVMKLVESQNWLWRMWWRPTQAAR